MEYIQGRPVPGNRDGLTYFYGVYGLSEWVALIPMGNAKLRIEFTGGSTSGYGVTPAVFATKNFHVAKAIDESPYYKEERIVGLGFY